MRLSTESLARASATRPWRVMAAWGVVLVVGAAAAAVFLGSALTSEADVATETEARRAQALIDEHFPDEPERELVLVRSRELSVEDRPFVQTLGRLTRELRAGEAVVSPDGHAALLLFVLGDREIDEVVRLAESVDAPPRLQVEVYGGAIVDRDFNAASKADLAKGETFGAAAALVVLVLVFGALVAAFVPLLLAGVSIVVSLGLVSLLGQLHELSIFVTNMLAGMGLALGVDYSLFVLSRFREERANGLERVDAITAAGATASRAVLFSGMAVAFALVGILFVPDTILRSLGVGAIVAAVVSVLAALTLLPAIVGLLGDRVNLGRLPAVGRRAEGRFWAWAARRVMRRPAAALVLSAALLVAASAPALDLTTGRLGVSTLPEEVPARQGYDLLRATFGYGNVFPTKVVADPRDVPRVRGLLAGDARFGRPAVERSADGRIAVVSVPIAGDPLSEQAFDAVRDLRARLPAGVLVTGITAGNLDYVDVTDAARPAVFAFVFGMSFLLLLVAFRSIVVPLKAIVLNLLAVGAAYGLLVLVFQKGVGAELLGFRQVDAIEVWVPVFLFSILFGLSMDYHVFLLSRIRERFVRTGDNDGAVAYGLASTGRVITGAALIIVVVFAGLALGDLVMLQQMGLGVGVALFLDATLIRSVLVPAAMTLLGRWNWYLPRRLAWLPQFQVQPPRR